MSDHRTYRRGILLAAVCLSAIGCAAPYTYCPEGDCGAVSLSGRFAADGTCAECRGAVVGRDRALGPGQMLRRTFTCGSGCGEIYWGDWINDPPSCDACDDHGNWTGTQCCPPSAWERLVAGIQGQQNRPTSDCIDCGADPGDTSNGVQIDGLTIDVPPAGGVPLRPPAIDNSPLPSDAAQIAAQPAEPHPLSRLKRRARR